MDVRIRMYLRQGVGESWIYSTVFLADLSIFSAFINAHSCVMYPKRVAMPKVIKAWQKAVNSLCTWQNIWINPLSFSGCYWYHIEAQPKAGNLELCWNAQNCPSELIKQRSDWRNIDMHSLTAAFRVDVVCSILSFVCSLWIVAEIMQLRAPPIVTVPTGEISVKNAL